LTTDKRRIVAHHPDKERKPDYTVLIFDEEHQVLSARATAIFSSVIQVVFQLLPLG